MPRRSVSHCRLSVRQFAEASGMVVVARQSDDDQGAIAAAELASLAAPGSFLRCDLAGEVWLVNSSTTTIQKPTHIQPAEISLALVSCINEIACESQGNPVR